MRKCQKIERRTIGMKIALAQMAMTEKMEVNLKKSLALIEQAAAGGALDVMQTEPVPADSPLRTAKHLLLTPHCAGKMALDYTREKSVAMFCEDLENYLTGKPLKYRVDKKRGY